MIPSINLDTSYIKNYNYSRNVNAMKVMLYMDLTTDKIFYFVLFFLPGFIFIKTYSLVVVSRNSDFSKEWYEAVAWGCIFFGTTYLIHLIFPLDLIWVIGIIIIPALIPFIIRKLINCSFVSSRIISPVPTSWDYIFGTRKPYWIILHLKDGRNIGGMYGVNSFTSSFPNPQDIYMEEVWRLDENNLFIEQVERTNGILIKMEEIASIELFEYREENPNGQNV